MCVCVFVVVVGVMVGADGQSDKDVGSQGLNSLPGGMAEPLSPS